MSGSTVESKVDQFFGYSARGSNFGTEVRAGLTTFATMAYILPVNMAILSQAGLDGGAVFMATALSAVLGTVLMALLARLPFALAPALGWWTLAASMRTRSSTEWRYPGFQQARSAVSYAAVPEVSTRSTHG